MMITNQQQITLIAMSSVPVRDDLRNGLALAPEHKDELLTMIPWVRRVSYQVLALSKCQQLEHTRIKMNKITRPKKSVAFFYLHQIPRKNPTFRSLMKSPYMAEENGTPMVFDLGFRHRNS